MQKSDEEQRWDWIPATQMVQTLINGESKFLDLNPQVTITHPDGNTQPDPLVRLYVDTEKQLQFTEEHGWNWHKSWNLPNISVRLEVKDQQTGDLVLPPKNLYTQLFAVKAVLENPQTFYLVDVGLRGLSRLELVDGHAFFTALRFASTSYNNEGVKFHLVLCLYIQEADDEPLRVITAIISPPIFVDSRKTSQNQSRIGQFADPFHLEILEKDFVKRENKKKTDHDIYIQNNFNGLLNYLTAPNIRHKVKHPLFLYFKFSSCFKIYFNNSLLNNCKIKQIIEKLQNLLIKDYPLKVISTVNEEKLFIYYVEDCNDQIKNKKIMESIDYLNFPMMQVIRNLDQLPPFFEELGPLEEVIDVYKKSFDYLIAMTRQFQSKLLPINDNFGSDSENSENSSYDSFEPSIEKKVKSQMPQQSQDYQKQAQQGIENQQIKKPEIQVENITLKAPIPIKAKTESNNDQLKQEPKPTLHQLVQNPQKVELQKQQQHQQTVYAIPIQLISGLGMHQNPNQQFLYALPQMNQIPQLNPQQMQQIMSQQQFIQTPDVQMINPYLYYNMNPSMGQTGMNQNVAINVNPNVPNMNHGLVSPINQNLKGGLNPITMNQGLPNQINNMNPVNLNPNMNPNMTVGMNQAFSNAYLLQNQRMLANQFMIQQQIPIQQQYQQFQRNQMQSSSKQNDNNKVKEENQ